MWIEAVNPDPNHSFAVLVEELERYGGTLTVTNERSTTSASKVVHLLLPDDEYRAKKCQEVLRQWNNAQECWADG